MITYILWYIHCVSLSKALLKLNANSTNRITFNLISQKFCASAVQPSLISAWEGMARWQGMASYPVICIRYCKSGESIENRNWMPKPAVKQFCRIVTSATQIPRLEQKKRCTEMNREQSRRDQFSIKEDRTKGNDQVGDPQISGGYVSHHTNSILSVSWHLRFMLKQPFLPSSVSKCTKMTSTYM